MLTKEDKRTRIQQLHSEAPEKYQQGDLKGALSSYQEAINLQAEQPEWVYSSAITILAKLGDVEEAVQLGDRALQLYQNKDEIYRALGIALEKTDNLQRCTYNYQKAIQLKQEQPKWVYIKVSNQLIKQRLFQQAQEIILKGLEIYPEEPDLIEIFQVVQNNIRELSSDVKLNSLDQKQSFPLDRIRWLLTQGVEKHHSGEFQVAVAFYLEAIELSHNQPAWVYANAIILLAELTRYDEAIKLGNQALKIHFQQDEVYRALGVALDKQGDIAGAIDNYQEATQLNSKQPEWVYANLAKRLIQVNRLERAINLSYQGIELYPQSYWLSYHLGEAFGFKEIWDKAIAYYQQALEIKPDLYQASQRLEAIIAKREHLEKMEKAYQEALTITPACKSDPQKLYVLEAYQDDPTGLGIVARRCYQLGELVADSRGVTGKVLVAARPDIYHELVRPENINYIWTTFESSQIPESWVNSINENFTNVFVPHPYVLEVFQGSGVNRPITVLPQSYPKRLRVKPIEKQTDRLRLGILGVPNRRKNFEKVIEAVVELRQEGHNVELMIHCPWLLDRNQKAWGDLPGITLTVEKLSDDEIDRWYSELDAYIYPSSGEGWSFTPREAISLGIPTIITDIQVHQELVESGFYLSINSNQWEPAYYEFLDGNCGEWKTYSVPQIKDAIVEMMDNYEYWYDLAETGKNWIAEESSTWEHSEKRLLEKIFPTAKNISQWLLEYAKNQKQHDSNRKISQDKQYELYLALSGVMG